MFAKLDANIHFRCLREPFDGPYVTVEASGNLIQVLIPFSVIYGSVKSKHMTFWFGFDIAYVILNVT